MMVDNVRITFDDAIQELMSHDDIIRLAESIHTFIELGTIGCEDGEEIFVDQEYLIDLVGSIERIRKANEKYGRDDNGFVKYQFEG
jgi:hypothetical protein